MKKNFFAKLGHFFLVSAVLFNGFGVGFVVSETPKEGELVPFTQFVSSGATVSETDAVLYPISVEYTGPTLVSDRVVNISVVSSTANFHFTDINGTEYFGSTSYSVTFPSSTTVSGNRQPIYLNIVNDDVPLGDTIIVLQDDENISSTFTLNITEDDTAIISSPTFSTSTFTFTEGNYAGRGNNFTTLKNTSDKELTYTVEITGSATLNNDYGFVIKDVPAFGGTLITASPATVNIPVNGEIEFYIATNNPLYNDGLYEGTEEAIFTVVNAVDTDTNTTYIFTENPVSTVTIEDNESRIGFISNGFGLEIDEISSISNDVVTSSYLAKLSNNGDGDALVVIKFSGSATLGVDFKFVETDPNFRRLGETPLIFVPAGKTSVVPLYVYNVDDDKTITMTIDKVMVGNAEVLLTAVTGNKTHTFTIVDNGPAPENRAPIASEQPITLDAIHVGDTSTPVSFPRTFSDPDLDALTYSVELSNPAIATSQITAGELVLTGTKAGTTIVTMMATDPDGLSASTTFSLTVTNNIPTVNIPIEPQLIDLRVSSTVTIDNATLKNLFSDADTNDRVAISLANNTDATVVTTTSDIEFSSLVLTGLKVGTSTIELTGNDQHGGIVTSTFDVVVTDSTPVVTPPTNTSSGGGSTLLSNTAPQAALTTGQEVTVEVNKEITFDASGSSDAENNIVFYFWNFGDGSPEVYYTIPTSIHTYTKVGTYTLTTKVKDSYGAESSAIVSVKVVAGSSTTTPNTDTTDNTTDNTSDNTETNNNTETETDNNTTDNTDTTPVNNTDSNIPVNNNEEETTVEEETTTEEENTSTEDDTTSENTKEEITEEVPAETTEELPTWIKIIFGSGALAAVAGAGLAINKVRKSV